MKTECTELFLRYREIAKIVWNLGFWPNVKLDEWDDYVLRGDTAEIYTEAMARMFEGMVLLALRCQRRIENIYSPGEIADFYVEANRPGLRLEVDGHRPEDSSHVWGSPVVFLNSQPATYKLKFVRFFDWDELYVRDFQYLEVLIERLDSEPHLVGHHALIETRDWSIWLVHNEDQDAGPCTAP